MEDKKTSLERGIYKVAVIGSIVNFLLFVFKLMAGFMRHSATMLADAVHFLSDFVTDLVVIVFVGISNKPQNKTHDTYYGYRY